MCAEDPVTGESFYFVDKFLLFGASICAVFQAFSDALKHIMDCQLQSEDHLTNYLDDFLFIAFIKLECDRMVMKFLLLCDQLGCPVAEEKTEWGTVIITFLGILLDGTHRVLSIPEDKRIKANNLLKWTLSRKTVTIRHLKQLTGTLNFLCRAIYVGRAFLRRMYDIMKVTDAKTGWLLKHYHHLRVNSELKKDCAMWLEFLANPAEVVLCRPFLDLHAFETSQTLKFYTDSSANGELGFGCVFNDRWIFGRWENNFVKDNDPSIEYLELAALCIAVLSWRHLLTNIRMVIFCDNQAVMHMVNKSTSKCKNCMVLLRELILDGLLCNRRVIVCYIMSRDNYLADSLSRQKLKLFKSLAPPSMNSQPDEINTKIWPLSKIWIK